jgi:hypothetical protein
MLTGLLGSVDGKVAQARESTGFLTFETGTDSESIDLPGISFSTTAGEPWVYGDVRTHQYNAPYPSDCSDRPAKIAVPICQYAVGENIFAWTGAVDTGGRFDFTQAGASFVDFDLATGAGTSVLAYNSANKAISAAYVKPNIGGSGERAVHLEAPAGEAIAYVTISGTANLWLLDNLATDAPGVPDQRPTKNDYPALVTVVQRAESAATLAPGSHITFTVVATNRGRGIAKSAIITMPLDTTRVRVDEATFSRSGAWVSALTGSALTIQTGSLGPNGDKVVATLHLTVLDDAAAGGNIGGPLAFVWRDGGSGGSGSSNTMALSVGGPAFAPALAASAAEGQITFRSTSFAPGEPVGLWYNTPDGRAVTLDTIKAKADGTVAFIVDVSGLPAGAYSMVANGHWTEFTAVAPFTRP